MPSLELLVRTFVELADCLVDDFDAVDLMCRLADRSAELLDVNAAGLMVADDHGTLRVVAASSEEVRFLELFQLQNDEGPCLESFRSGRPVSSADLEADARWPVFAPAAVAAGFRSIHTVPMRLRDRVLGGLNLFGGRPGEFEESEALLAQALADIATITILQERAARSSQTLSEQLQRALQSRVVIEQAKGVVAEQHHVGVDIAFARLRRYARDHNRRLTEVAEEVVEGRFQGDLAPPPG